MIFCSWDEFNEIDIKVNIDKKDNIENKRKLECYLTFGRPVLTQHGSLSEFTAIERHKKTLLGLSSVFNVLK
ncbi:MAG TPA: hypothetical protein DCM28_03180 [Phycisphaerales bacterium]|nr:hypothetical protein [Phycisphaerales bacterium]